MGFDNAFTVILKDLVKIAQKNFKSFNFFLDVPLRKVGKFSKFVTFAILGYYPLDLLPKLLH